ncbi:hypothetical protein CC79DRAFT_1330330 [Sarocladium strictum]
MAMNLTYSSLDRPLAEVASRQQTSIQPPTPGLTAISGEAWNSAGLGSRQHGTDQQSQDHIQARFRTRRESATVSSSAVDLILDGVDSRAMGQLYLTWCHNQPLCLFRAEVFLDSLTSRDVHLLLALQALALRFPPGAITAHDKKKLSEMAIRARQLAMKAIANSRVELSIIQTLVILSLVDLADGHPWLAQVDLDTAASLARVIPPGFTLGDPQECSDCLRGIVMAQNLFGNISGSTLSAFKASTDESSSPSSSYNGLPPPQMENSMLSCLFEMSDAWRMMRDYAAVSVGPDSPPPWSRQSDYSAVMQRHLELDTSIPLKYRFAANKFEEQSPETLQSDRHYWGPYVALQLVYATIPCVINHPFLLSMRLRNFRHTMPQAFIHQSFEHITRHAGWIMYFIDILDKKDFRIADHALAYCATVAATIHLQHSFVPEQALREKSQDGFQKCTVFLRGMGTVLPSISSMADKLESLKDSIVLTTSGPSMNHGGRTSRSIDSKLLWGLLTYPSTLMHAENSQQHIFGSALTPVPSSDNERAIEGPTEYDLIGSAGISGHKTVPRDIPVYAPQSGATPRDTAVAVPYLFEDRHMETGEGESNYEALFFQADDFGRAIDEWMSFNEVTQENYL